MEAALEISEGKGIAPRRLRMSKGEGFQTGGGCDTYYHKTWGGVEKYRDDAVPVRKGCRRDAGSEGGWRKRSVQIGQSWERLVA